MGDCPNYGPFLGPYYNTGPNTGPNLGDPKRDHNFNNLPYAGDLLEPGSCSDCVLLRGGLPSPIQSDGLHMTMVQDWGRPSGLLWV